MKEHLEHYAEQLAGFSSAERLRSYAGLLEQAADSSRKLKTERSDQSAGGNRKQNH